MREISGIPWQPRYLLTPAMARRLMEIEAARAVVEQIPLPPAVVSEMRNQARPSRYRDGQNTIRDSATGTLVYLPPEAKDAPTLMAGLVACIGRPRSWRRPAVSG